MHVSDRDVSENNKNVPIQERILEAYDGAEALWMWQVSNLSKKKIESERCPPFPGRTRTHRLDLELLFWAALMWSCRCPSSAQHSPFLVAFVPQNTFLDIHKPSIPFPDPTDKHISVLKPCFSTFNCLEWIAVLPVSYLPFMRRGEDERSCKHR